MKVIAAIALLLIAASARAGDFASDFALVMIDDETEAKFGAFPYDRKLYAEAVDACARYKARAVVLKFFLDQAKSAEGDTALRDSMKRIPVALQARLESTEGSSQRIPSKFGFGQQRLAAGVRGDRGWIPLPSLLDVAAAIGFVDFDSPEIPLVEEYRSMPYKSLILCCLELAIRAPARVATDSRIYVGSGYLPVNASNIYRADVSRLESLKIISFAHLLAGDVKKEEIEGRVVIIGWDSTRTSTLPTEYGKMRIHRLFSQLVAASYRTLKANQAPTPTTVTPPARQEARQP